MILRSIAQKTLKNFFAMFSIAFLVALPVNCLLAVSGDGLIAYPTTSDPENSLSESWFIYKLERGTGKEDYLTIKNESNQPQSVKLYVVDSTTNNMGEFALEGETDSKDGIGKWLTLETDHLVIAANEEKQVKLNINIPEDAPAGEISGGVIIQKDLTEAQKNTKSGFIINTRIGIRVYETVPGETLRRVSFGSGSVQYNEKDKVYSYSVNVKNEGNVSIESTVKILLKDTLFGKQNRALEQKVNIPRGEETKLTFPLEEAKIGKFEISSELEYQKADGSKETIINTDKASFWAFPQEWIPIIGLLLLANIIFLVMIKLIKRRERKRYKTYKIRIGDNLENISERLDMNWKKIAKINKLKAPYQLEEGQTITVIDKKNVLDETFPEGEMLTEPTERVRQDRKEAFEKDLALIGSDKEDSTSKTHKKSGWGKKIFKSLVLGAISMIGGYLVYTQVIVKDNNANFVYDRSEKNAPESSEQLTDVSDIKKTEENAQNPSEVDQDANKTASQEKTVEEITAADRQAIKLEILNGSGVKGASSKAAATFKEQGYTAITTGNADRFDYDKTIIKCGSAVKSGICTEIETILSQTSSVLEMQESSDITEVNKVTITLGK